MDTNTATGAAHPGADPGLLQLGAGHCLPLDMACPQQLSPSRVSCKYFRTAVLPAEKELYAEIIRQNRKDGDDNGLPRMV